MFRNLFSGLALATVTALSAQAEDVRLTLHHFMTERSATHSQMLVPWAARVNELSGGSVTIDIYPSMTLGGRPPELVQQARDGVVDLVWTLNGYTPGLFPRTEVFELPTVHVNDPTATNLALREMFDEHLAEDYPGLEVIFLHVHTGNGFQMVDKPIESAADADGLNLRTPSRTGAWVIEALGGNPVAMPLPELPLALSRGVVDGALIPWEVIPPQRLQEQTTYQVEGANGERLGTALFQFSMNKARWESLPDAAKEAIRQASDEAFLTEIGELWKENEVLGIKVATDAGNTHVKLSEAETAALFERLEPVVDRWVETVSSEGVDGEMLVKTAREVIAAKAE